jgi:MtrB/PioB family decaheme-associated outer membrane protein
MKKTYLKSITRLAFSVLVSFPLLGVNGEEKASDKVSVVEGQVNGGGQLLFLRGDNEKFNEYRDIESNPVLNGFNLHVEDDFLFQDSDKPFSFDLDAKNFLRDDQFYRLQLIQPNLKLLPKDKLKFGVQFNATPHTFTGRKLLFGSAGSSHLTMDDGSRAYLQSVEQLRSERSAGAIVSPHLDTTGEDALAQGTIFGLFDQRERGIYKILREKTSISLQYDFAEQVQNWIRFSKENKSGTRVINAGTYERYSMGAAGAAHVADEFFISGAELAEPIDFQTASLNFGSRFFGGDEKKYQTSIEYTFTDFYNDETALTWDNPFRTSDAIATAAAGGAGNPFNRGRFATGQLSLVPASQSHEIAFSGGLDLPYNSHFVGNVSLGWITQDTPFVPYTRNTAISATAGFDVTQRSNLPRKDLAGLVQTLNQSYRLTSRPVDKLDLTARYLYSQYDDQSDKIRFPGYAAYGESFWRTVRNDRNAPVENKPFSFTKHTVDLNADYQLLSPLACVVEGGWEAWDRKNLRVNGTEEAKIGNRFVYKPFHNVRIDAGYMHFDRSMEGYQDGNTANNPEAIGLVNYDVADRQRHKGKGSLHVEATEKLSLGFSGQVVDDSYDKDSRFGLKEVQGYFASADMAYNLNDRVSFHGGYSYENDRSLMKSGAKDDAFNLAGSLDDDLATDSFNPNNYWNTTITDEVHSLTAGAEFNFLKEKLFLNFFYNLSYAENGYDTVNPNGIPKLANAGAQSWPLITSIMHEARAELTYKITSDLSIGASYLVEVFELNDFTWGNTENYMANTTVENTTRYVFSDATYSDYTAHVVQIFANYRW